MSLRKPGTAKILCSNESRASPQVLRLSENGIVSVDRKAFLNLGTSLEELDLRGNQLKLIEEETFRPLYGLQVYKLFTKSRFPHFLPIPGFHISY